MVEVLATIAVGCAFLAAALIDIRERRIPNAVVAVVATLGLVRLVAVATVGAGMTVVLIDGAVAIAGFFILLPAFRFGVMGGGDVKLITAGILWFGASGAASFVVVTLMAGGVLSLGMLAFVRLRGSNGLSPDSEKVPYGVAIAVGALVTGTLGILTNSPILP